MNKSNSKIGCDIGGVLMEFSEAIEGAIEGINLLNKNHEIVFISKCKLNMQKTISSWLLENKLDDIKVNFCLDDGDKKLIADKEKISIYIDDKISNVNSMANNINKIWFCRDNKKILGAKKYNQLHGVNIASSWEEIINLINNF